MSTITKKKWNFNHKKTKNTLFKFIFINYFNKYEVYFG